MDGLQDFFQSIFVVGAFFMLPLQSGNYTIDIVLPKCRSPWRSAVTAFT